MSHVTNVILVIGVLDKEAIEPLQGWLAGVPGAARLAEVSDGASGPKALEAHLYAGAFNFFPLEDFIEQVAAISWDSATLLMQDEHDDAPAVYRYGVISSRNPG